MPDKPDLGPWKLALIRMLQPNPDLRAETCEWIIALFAIGILFIIGVVVGRFTR